ncbi:MAG: hypothetical protein C0469_18075 [Cyanobacteria bacterium DS2.3.42]|nr:hypothetical protein [Cyanobacteria bacterium DS2.3.42]
MSRPYTGVPSLKGLLLVGLLIFGGYHIFTAFSSHNWPEVTGKVTGYDIQESYRYRGRRSYGSSREYTPVVQYIYLVDHVSHEGSVSLRTFSSYNEAINFAGGSYPKGMHLQVLYNPKMPNFSTLTRSAI